MKRGMLLLVVGPSGSGKDSLISGAHRALASDGRFAFAKREITRLGDAGGEDHLPITETEFVERQRSGGYALSWRAHGLCYGIPAKVEGSLGSGHHIIANVSRTVVADARTRFQPMAVVNVRVDADTLRARLRARGRESEAEIAQRIARAASYPLDCGDVMDFRNDAPLAESIAGFVALLRSLAADSGIRSKTLNGAPGASWKKMAK